MKRLIALVIALFFVNAAIRANEEINITLSIGETGAITKDLGYGIISFNLKEYGSSYRVAVSIENTTTSEALLIFRNTETAKELKKNKPKVEFEKKYPGNKDDLKVKGCKELRGLSVIPVMPENHSDLFGIDVSPRNIRKFQLPIYRAKYKQKQLKKKKNPYEIDYKILCEDIIDFNIELKGWSEKDPDYISTKSAVESYLQSVDSISFCKNRKHVPSFEDQLRPYQAKKDSLINVINTTLSNHQREWYLNDIPTIRYKELLDQLNKVNLFEHASDCGKHKSVVRSHNCSYCSMSAQQIYHQLDDIYQQLRVGKLPKEAAVKKAQSLNSCYQRSTRRKKDSVYTEKISVFVSRIINY